MWRLFANKCASFSLDDRGGRTEQRIEYLGMPDASQLSHTRLRYPGCQTLRMHRASDRVQMPFSTTSTQPGYVLEQCEYPPMLGVRRRQGPALPTSQSMATTATAPRPAEGQSPHCPRLLQDGYVSPVYPTTTAVRSLQPLWASGDPFQGGPLNQPPGPAAVQHNVNMVSRALASVSCIRPFARRGASPRQPAR